MLILLVNTLIRSLSHHSNRIYIRARSPDRKGLPNVFDTHVFLSIGIQLTFTFEFV